jgi:hypothetical protein
MHSLKYAENSLNCGLDNWRGPPYKLKRSKVCPSLPRTCTLWRCWVSKEFEQTQVGQVPTWHATWTLSVPTLCLSKQCHGCMRAFICPLTWPPGQTTKTETKFKNWPKPYISFHNMALIRYCTHYNACTLNPICQNHFPVLQNKQTNQKKLQLLKLWVRSCCKFMSCHLMNTAASKTKSTQYEVEL